ncbi:hypothetical protein D043_1974B, partial [Vibrio parahaemolyticus EKP-021]
EILLSRLRYVL